MLEAEIAELGIVAPEGLRARVDLQTSDDMIIACSNLACDGGGEKTKNFTFFDGLAPQIAENISRSFTVVGQVTNI
ncbi:hypothetical protein KCU85_g167, partial [Aureobasidium melanogenum]